jgi:serine/threonine protein kinase
MATDKEKDEQVPEPADGTEESFAFPDAAALTPIDLPEWNDMAPPGAATVQISPDDLLRSTVGASGLIDADFTIPDKVKHYKVVREIGAGGMGKVFKCMDTELGRFVALKVLHGSLTHDQNFVRRFKKEGLAIAKIRHPNIIQIYSIETFEDFLFLTMEYVEGEGLDARIRRHGRIPEKEALNLLRQISDGLAHVHRAGILHRDIKPGNILIDSSDRAMIADFGLAKVLFEQILRDVGPVETPEGLVSTQTEHGHIMGTPYYLSPESIQGRPADERSEVYSLGIVMYEMLTGRVPFDDSTVNALFRKHLFDFPPPIAEIAPDVSLDVANIVYQAMEKKPNNRFPDMKAFHQTLTSVVQNWRMAGELEERRRLSIEMARVLTASSRTASPRPARRLGITLIVLVILVVALGFFARTFLDLGEIQAPVAAGAWTAGHPATLWGRVLSVTHPALPPEEFRLDLELSDHLRSHTVRARVSLRALAHLRERGFDPDALAQDSLVLLSGTVDGPPEGTWLRVDRPEEIQFPGQLIVERPGTPAPGPGELLAGAEVILTGMVLLVERGRGGRTAFLLGPEQDELVRVFVSTLRLEGGGEIAPGDEVSARGVLKAGKSPTRWTLDAGKDGLLAHHPARR